MDKYIAVNYHYIREQSDNGIKACTVGDFLNHLDYLSDNYKIVRLAELYNNVLKGVKGNYCSLTFDDGLTEHFDVAFQALKERGLTGIFFPIGLPIKERRVPLTHKLQLILSRKSVADLVSLFQNFFKNKYKIDDKVRIEPRRRFDDVLTSNLKETLMRISFEERSSFINDIFAKLYEDEATIARQLFMPKESIAEMSKGGMDIGIHTYNHLSMEVLSSSEQEKEIEESLKILANIVNGDLNVFSYPHGRYSEETLKLLDKSGFALGVRLGSESLSSATHKFLIPRYDANDFNSKILKN